VQCVTCYCAGLVALVAALTQQRQQQQQQQGLQELLLHGCSIDASGVQALASSTVLASLVHLSLAHNTELGADAAQHLAVLLQSAPQLQSLKLQGTNLGDAGSAAVVSAAAREGAGSLQELDLSNTGCGALLG
jgi:Ran GTPase-activating protein (RanGAP) involved in mRNA processing and transport